MPKMQKPILEPSPRARAKGTPDCFVPWDQVPVGSLKRRGRVCIYALLDPRDNAVRYVGATTSQLDVRVANHMSTSANPLVQRWTQELRRLGLRAIARKLCISTYARRDYDEQRWIGWFRGRGTLLNRVPWLPGVKSRPPLSRQLRYRISLGLTERMMNRLSDAAIRDQRRLLDWIRLVLEDALLDRFRIRRPWPGKE